MIFTCKFITYDDYLSSYNDSESGYNSVRNNMLSQGLITQQERDSEIPISENDYTEIYGDRGCATSFKESHDSTNIVDGDVVISDSEALAVMNQLIADSNGQLTNESFLGFEQASSS